MTVRVLLVDTHEEARRSLVRRLKSDGRVTVAADVPTVAEAGVVLQSSPCDLALMNIQSHDTESIVRCQQFRGLTGIPLVVLTSFMTKEHWNALRQAGAADYVLKDANSQRLGSEIVRLADRHCKGRLPSKRAERTMSEEPDEHEQLPLRASEEHEALLGAIHQLEDAFSSLELGSESGWRERAASELRTVASSIEHHCQSAEASDGLLTQVERDAGRSETVSAAHHAHEQLCEQARALIVLVSEDVQIDVVREKAAEIAKILRLHLDLVAALVNEAAFESETGVGD